MDTMLYGNCISGLRIGCSIPQKRQQDACHCMVMYICMYVCMYVCMYACRPRKKNNREAAAKQHGNSSKPTGTQKQHRRRRAATRQTKSRNTAAEKQQHGSNNSTRRSSKTTGAQHESLQKVPCYTCLTPGSGGRGVGGRAMQGPPYPPQPGSNRQL